MPRSPIPTPRLQKVHNETRFTRFFCDKMGVGRKFFDTLVVKGTYTLAAEPSIAARQAPIALVDDYWDTAAPERSSLNHAGEALLMKPSTDVLVTGTARAPKGKAKTSWDTAVVVRRRGETVIDSRARVVGPRTFRHGANGWVLTNPEPTAEVPIRYELAYGGAYPAKPSKDGEAPNPPWVVHAPNPSGTGFFDEDAMDTAVEYRAPQWEPLDRPVTGINREVPLAGFAPVARPWSSRIKHAGTYDDAWIQGMREDVAKGLPADYAADFDPRFFQCAPPDLITPRHLEGDEEIELVGLVPDAESFKVRLPNKRLEARLIDGKGDWHAERMLLDTVRIDLDFAVVYLCWRLTLDQTRDIRSAIVGTEGT